MWVAHTVEALRTLRRPLTGQVAVVPTMGALHAGHISLIQAARELADAVIVTIFVNPTQFAPHEDFTRYPRPIERDLAACRAAGAVGVYNPSVQQMYPPDAIAADVNIPSMAHILEGEIRPTHFAGVCRVVAKLFNMIQPDLACFGQKDYQQLKIIEAMTRDLAFPIRIVACPTMREPDGLAMSSRNVYLTPEQRDQALGLYRALQLAQQQISNGQTRTETIEHAMAQLITQHGLKVDYTVIRHADTLQPLPQLSPATPAVALVAARFEQVRLIDNMRLHPTG